MALTNKLTAIADSIRGKLGTTDAMTLDEMPNKISSIETGPSIQESKTVEITVNGTTEVIPDDGYGGIKKVGVSVAVPMPAPALQKKSISITANGTGSVLPDAGKDGLSEVDYTVNVPASSTPVLQEKAVTITENGTTEVTPDSGQDGLSKVAVTTSVPSIIRGSLSEVVPVAFEMLKKAQNLPATPYGRALKRGVPVYFNITIQGGPYEFWGSLRFSENKPTSNSLIWQSRALSKKETGFAADIWFVVDFPIVNGAVDTDNYYLYDNGVIDGFVKINLIRTICATITNWLN